MLEFRCENLDGLDGTVKCVFLYNASAYTLDTGVIGEHADNKWIISADIVSDYFEWVNYFEATHPDHGWVRGDFEKTVYASSYTALGNFLDNFQPQNWDYADI